MSRRLSWKPALLWTLFGFTLVVFGYMHQMQLAWKPISLVQQNEYVSYDLELEEPIDPVQTCQMPRIHPFDPSILRYLAPSKPIKCKVRQEQLTFIDKDGVLRFNSTALRLSGYAQDEVPSCSYQELIRPNQSDSEVNFGERQPLPKDGVRILFDFVSVSCYNFAGIAFYSNIHLHIHPKTLLTPNPQTPDNSYNVLILGIDSLSRLSFIRHMPKTYRYLTGDMKAFVFRGMTKVGDNTFPNLGAILTGKSVFGNELEPVEKGGTYDSWPCIWKNFSDHGYVTMFGEDRPDIALFNYLRGGFRDSPTDHYLRPYWLAVQTSSVHRLSSNLCFGSVPKHLLQLNYTRNFVSKYSATGQPFFGFSFFVEISHDYMTRVSVTDEDFEEFLKDLHTSGSLNRTFFVFLSDHGHRFDAMRATLVGRIEERMPFFAMSVPSDLSESKPELLASIRKNLGRLTSPYDLYYTMLDILRFSEKGDEFGRVSSARGVSLFSEISPNRTCDMAGIPDHYCTCEEEKSIDIEDPRSQKAAEVLVDQINEFLDFFNGNESKCQRLNLSEIRRSDIIVPNSKVIINSRVYFGKLLQDGQAAGMMSKLRLVIVTTPGDALFEGTLLHREDSGYMSVLGDVSRINKYGQQSWCIEDATMRKYCYCVDQKYPDDS